MWSFDAFFSCSSQQTFEQIFELPVIWNAIRSHYSHPQHVTAYPVHTNDYSSCFLAWWRHQMETFSALLALCAGNSPVIGEFPVQRHVKRSFGVFFDLRLNKRLSKQSVIWDAIALIMTSRQWCFIVARLRSMLSMSYSSELLHSHWDTRMIAIAWLPTTVPIKWSYMIRVNS